MAKWQNDIILDQALNYIKNNATQISVCSAQPTTYAEAITTYKLAIRSSLTSGSFTGPADGDTQGRKITVHEQDNITVDATNTATHVALCSADTLLCVTTCNSLLLTAGNETKVPAWKITLNDAS